MKNILVLIVAMLLFIGCNKTGVPISYVDMCKPENDKKIVEVQGFLNPKGGAMCSKRGKGPMECPIKFSETLGSSNTISADIKLGKWGWANEIQETKEGLKIHDNNGDVVDVSKKLKVTGRAHVFDVPNKPNGGCYLTVTKIEI